MHSIRAYLPMSAVEIRVAPRFAPTALIRPLFMLVGKVLLAAVAVIGVLGYLAICFGHAAEDGVEA